MVLRALIILNPTIFALYDLKQDPAPFQIITPYPKITLSGYQGHPKLSTFSSKSGLGLLHLLAPSGWKQANSFFAHGNKNGI